MRQRSRWDWVEGQQPGRFEGAGVLLLERHKHQTSRYMFRVQDVGVLCCEAQGASKALSPRQNPSDLAETPRRFPKCKSGQRQPNSVYKRAWGGDASNRVSHACQPLSKGVLEHAKELVSLLSSQLLLTALVNRNSRGRRATTVALMTTVPKVQTCFARIVRVTPSNCAVFALLSYKQEDTTRSGLRATLRALVPKAQSAYIRIWKGWKWTDTSAVTMVFEGSRPEADLQRSEVHMSSSAIDSVLIHV